MFGIFQVSCTVYENRKKSTLHAAKTAQVTGRFADWLHGIRPPKRVLVGQFVADFHWLIKRL